MDPNETLNHIRAHIDEALNAKTILDTASYLTFAAVKFTELDNWLSNGGMPPEDWMPQADDGELT